MSRPLRFGVHAGPTDVPYWAPRDYWCEAERLGYDWASLSDHFVANAVFGARNIDPWNEAWTSLAALAENGRHLQTDAINSLIRRVLHGIVPVERPGKRIGMTSHLLRHAAATVQHQHYGVPLETLAEAMGHTFGADGQPPEATQYYSHMTETQKAEIRHDTAVAMMDDAQLAVRVIEPDAEGKRIQPLMTEADEQTREVLERYGGLHPVTFGHCGAIQVCAFAARLEPFASAARS